jgi:succinate dehydrogenase / fumarate reductase cytochrome b subunit
LVILYFSQVKKIYASPEIFTHPNIGELSMRYVKHYGTWGYILHRLSGLALTGYILIHIYLVSGLHNRPAWRSEMEIFRHPLLIVLEWCLFSVVIYHALNGLRIFMIDYFNGARYQKQLLTAVLVLSVILFAAMGAVMFI